MTTSNAFNLGRAYDVLEGRNRIINGACTVAQRGSVTVTSGTGGPYGGPDRYALITAAGAAGSVTQSQSSFVYNGVTRNCVTQTVASPATNIATGNFWGGIQQFIEGVNCFDLAFSPISISFLFSSNVSGTFSVALRDSTPVQSYVTTFAYTAGSPQKIIVNIPQPTVALTIPSSTSAGLYVTIGAQNTGTYSASTLNAWQSGNFFASATSSPWSNTTNNFIAISELQLEQGSVASTFERENYSLTFSKCQRYYQLLGTQLVGGNAGAGVTVYQDWQFPTMRATPASSISGTVTYSNASNLQVAGIISLNGLRMSVVISAAGYGYGYGEFIVLNAEL